MTEEIKPLPGYRFGVLKVTDFAPEHQVAFKSAKRRVKVRQVGGDDGYQYCLFVEGMPMANGMMLSEARGRMDRAIRNLMNGKSWFA